MYSLEYSEVALKQLKKLPQNVQKRIIAVLERSRIRPQAHAKKLVGNNLFRLRAGDYRIMVDINNNKINILVIKMGHRRNIYD